MKDVEDDYSGEQRVLNNLDTYHVHYRMENIPARLLFICINAGLGCSAWSGFQKSLWKRVYQVSSWPCADSLEWTVILITNRNLKFVLEMSHLNPGWNLFGTVIHSSFLYMILRSVSFAWSMHSICLYHKLPRRFWWKISTVILGSVFFILTKIGQMPMKHFIIITPHNFAFTEPGN